MKKMGIYQIKNVLDNKIYIGSASDLRKRKNTHFELLQNNKHHSIHLQRAWNKYGGKNFTFNIIEFVKDQNELIEREQYWLDFYKSYLPKNGYNIVPKAGSTLGYKASDETKLKISLKGKGRKFTEEHKKKISEALQGKPKSKEARKHMSESRKGKRIGEQNSFYGKIHSQETKEKLRQINLGRQNPKHSKWMTGENNPQFGKPLTEYQYTKLMEGYTNWLETPEGLAFRERNRQRLLGNKLGTANKGKNRPRSIDPKP